MEKLVVTRHKGGSFESRSSQIYPLQPRHASQGKKSMRRGLDLPLERNSKRPAASTERSNRHSQAVSYTGGGEPGGRPTAFPPQREQTTIESQTDNVWGTHQPLPRSRTTAFVEVSTLRKQV